MKIYLIGYMGSGKSILGRELSLKLGYNFVDLDEMIELNKNQTINSIFENHGEATFRDFEKEVLHQTESLNNTVIATGGGAPCFSDNISWMNQNGLTVYLKVSLGKLFHRLASSKSERPLIKDKPDLELMDYMKKNLLKREEFYAQSKIIIENDEIDALMLEKEIKKEIDYSK